MTATYGFAVTPDPPPAAPEGDGWTFYPVGQLREAMASLMWPLTARWEVQLTAEGTWVRRVA
jgi:hypothetical protein